MTILKRPWPKPPLQLGLPFSPAASRPGQEHEITDLSLMPDGTEVDQIFATSLLRFSIDGVRPQDLRQSPPHKAHGQVNEELGKHVSQDTSGKRGPQHQNYEPLRPSKRRCVKETKLHKRPEDVIMQNAPLPNEFLRLLATMQAELEKAKACITGTKACVTEMKTETKEGVFEIEEYMTEVKEYMTRANGCVAEMDAIARGLENHALYPI